MIGKICRCEINENRNAYLIQDCVMYELKKKLDFNSYQEILWGSPKERAEYYPILFLLLLTDLVDSSSPYKDQINRILCGYIPYARYLGYYKIIFEEAPLFPDASNAELYDIDIRELILSVDHYFSCAVDFLYRKCKQKFIELYNTFADNHDSFKRWTYRFEEWIQDQLFPMLSEYMPSDKSLGIRILNIIEEDYSKIPLLNITYDADEVNIIHNLLSASEKYITSLEHIQINNPYIEI